MATFWDLNAEQWDELGRILAEERLEHVNVHIAFDGSREQTAHELRSIEGLLAAVTFDDHERHVLASFVGGKAVAAADALAAPTDGIVIL